jgi:hypothetical protein
MQITKEEAIKFFAEFFKGEHHIPVGLKPWGEGWCVNTKICLSTFDSNDLTRLVLMAHEYAVRVELIQAGLAGIKIVIHQRTREGRMFERHPTIEQVLEMTQIAGRI